MLTRRHITRNHWGTGHTAPDPGTGTAAPHVPGWRAGDYIAPAGEVPLILPPTVVQMDPSDRATWTTAVRWT